MADQMAAVERINRMSINNRRSSAAKGMESRTPRKTGAQRGFRSNPTNRGRIASVAGRQGSTGLNAAGNAGRRVRSGA